MANVLLKICGTCENELPATTEYFHLSKNGLFGLRGDCKVCRQMVSLLERRGLHFTVLTPIKADKRCGECKKTFPRTLEYFYAHSTSNSRDKLQGVCKSCSNTLVQENYWNNLERERKKSKKWRQNNPAKVRAYSNARRALKLHATPLWVNKSVIEDVYINCPSGYQVDHIVPLKNKQVCGLHVPWNLQYLTPTENLIKGNKLLGEVQIYS